MVKSDCFIHCFFPLGTRERTEGPGPCLHLAYLFLFPLPSSPSLHFKCFLLSLSRLLFFSTECWALDFPGLSWFLLKDSHSRSNTHIFIYMYVYMLLFFCFLAPSGLCGVIWFNYFWHFAHQKCAILQRDGNDSESASSRAIEVFLWILLSWKQVSFIEHTPTIMVKTSARGITPPQSILCFAQLRGWLAAGLETGCEWRHLDSSLTSETIHMAIGKSNNLFEPLFPYLKNGKNRTASIYLKFSGKIESGNRHEKALWKLRKDRQI